MLALMALDAPNAGARPAVAATQGDALPEGFEVRAVHPHDVRHFTQGLVWQDGALWESAGGYGSSSVHRKELSTGRSLLQASLPASIFAEGLAFAAGRWLVLTWREGLAFELDSRLQTRGQLQYAGEGWGLASGRLSGKPALVMSDGSEQLTWREPETLAVVRRLPVTRRGQAVTRLNELEIIRGHVWANVWHSSRIVVVEPINGEVLAELDLAALQPAGVGYEDVLNGIAYDPERDRVFVTGKRWPLLFELGIHWKEDR